MKKHYIPSRGDIIHLNFNPQSGKEQAGKRPALVLSPKTYNQKTGLALMCPITSKVKGYPFEITIPARLKTKGVILADHIKNLDWQTRSAKFLEKLPRAKTEETLYKLQLLLD
jgi:mRNA interferase MazF